MGIIQPIHHAYYDKLRRVDGLEAGDALERMRERFPSASRPHEVECYRDVLADAYLADFNYLDYKPGEHDLAIARELRNQGALIEVRVGVFVLTEPGFATAYRIYEQRVGARRVHALTLDSGSNTVWTCLLSAALTLAIIAVMVWSFCS